MIELNNKRKLKIEVIEDYLKLTFYDANGEVEQRRTIDAGDLVLLIDYYITKKDNNEPIL